MHRRINSRELRDLRGESDPPPPPESGDAFIGQLVAERYRVVRKLGEGAQASVYIAKHTLIKRFVALKILRPPITADRQLVRRFLDEGQVAGTIGHPNIVESLDMGATDDGCPYLVLEYLEGTTLGAELAAKGAFDAGRAAYVTMQIASALGAAHQRGIVHRDLKPENVFLVVREGRTDHVKVIDFGISKFQHRSEADPSAGMVFGTPDYMAPEQVTSPATVDSRADVFALGAMLYEMLSGRPPLDLSDASDVLEAIVRRMPAPLGSLRADLPAGLVAVVERALHKDRGARYQHVADMRAELEPFAVASTFVTGSGNPPPRDSSRVLAAAAGDASEPPRTSMINTIDPQLPRAHVVPPDRESDPQARAAAVPEAAPNPPRAARPARVGMLVAAAILALAVVVAFVALRHRSPRIVAQPQQSDSTGATPPLGATAGTAATPLLGATASTAMTAPPVPSETGDPANVVPMPGSAGQPKPLHPGAAGGQKRRTADMTPGAVGASGASAGLAAAVAPPTPSEAAPVAQVPQAAPPPVTPPVTSPVAPPVTSPAAPPIATVAPGTIAPREVSATVRSHASEVQGCFDRARMNNAEVRGRVSVRAGVDPAGHVTSAGVGSTTANDTRLESCLVGAFRRWTFPPPAGGVAGTVTYTFVFE